MTKYLMMENLGFWRHLWLNNHVLGMMMIRGEDMLFVYVDISRPGNPWLKVLLYLQFASFIANPISLSTATVSHIIHCHYLGMDRGGVGPRFSASSLRPKKTCRRRFFFLRQETPIGANTARISSSNAARISTQNAAGFPRANAAGISSSKRWGKSASFRRDLGILRRRQRSRLWGGRYFLWEKK